MNALPAWIGLSLTPEAIEWIGAVAAMLTTGSFIPQVWLTFRTRDVSGISLGMYSCFTLGVALWLLYGLSIGSLPVTVANVVTLSLASAILGMKLYHGRKRRT
jgi:MtN3 and saliva related transmembrane protein